MTNKYINCAFGLLIMLGLSSCQIYDSENYRTEPAYIVTDNSYRLIISDVFEAAHLTDFFSEYQKIRSDREASLELAEKYFGKDIQLSYLFYEEAKIDGMTVSLSEDGSFKVSIPNSQTYGLIMECTVTTVSDRQFNIVAKFEPYPYYNGTVDADNIVATVFCDDEYVYVGDLDISYTSEAIDYSILSDKDVKMKRNMFRPEDSFQPVGGRLSFSLKGEVEDDFTVDFYNDCLVIGRAGDSVKCEPLRESGSYSVDYVIE